MTEKQNCTKCGDLVICVIPSALAPGGRRLAAPFTLTTAETLSGMRSGIYVCMSCGQLYGAAQLQTDVLRGVVSDEPLPVSCCRGKIFQSDPLEVHEVLTRWNKMLSFSRNMF